MPPTSRFPVLMYFERGGEWMWPLLICSIVAVGVILYKLWSFLTLRANIDALLKQTAERVAAGEIDSAVKLCEASRSPAAQVVVAGLQRAGADRRAIREAAEDEGQHQLGLLESALPTLSTVANISPLLGFLGTVTGMIQAFMAISEKGLGDPAVVAAGISKALITTATGLIIAIPCFAAYNYFVARVRSFGLEMERAVSHVVNLLTPGADQDAV